MFFNHKLQGFYICKYDPNSLIDLRKSLSSFKEDEYSIMLTMMEQVRYETIFETFVHSDSLAVWYELDTMIQSIDNIPTLDIRKKVEAGVCGKFKELVACYKPG